MYRNFRFSKLQNLMAGYYSETCFLQKNALRKNGPSPISNKLDFFRGIHISAALSIIGTYKIFTEMFLFLTSRSIQ